MVDSPSTVPESTIPKAPETKDPALSKAEAEIAELLKWVDIMADDSETDTDKRIRAFTIRELAKSKQMLPPKRFEALFREIKSLMTATTCGVYELGAESEISFKISKANGLQGMEEHEIDDKQGCLRDKFDPALINGRATAQYFSEALSTPGNTMAFKSLLKGDTALLSGFIRYWAMQKEPGMISDKSNVVKILSSTGREPTVRLLDTLHSELLSELGIQITKDDLVPDKKTGKLGKILDKVEKSRALKGIRVVEVEKGIFKNTPESHSKFEELMSGTQSLAGFSNLEIANLLSYVHVNQNDPNVQGGRNAGVLSKFVDKISNDPAGLIVIAENWGTKARRHPSIDMKMQINGKAGAELIWQLRLKDGFKNASDRCVRKFVDDYNEIVDKDAVVKKITEAVDKVPWNSKGNNFVRSFGSEVIQILREAGVKDPKGGDALRIVRQLLSLEAGRGRLEYEEAVLAKPELAPDLQKIRDAKDRTELESFMAWLDEKKYPKHSEGRKTLERAAKSKCAEFDKEALDREIPVDAHHPNARMAVTDDMYRVVAAVSSVDVAIKTNGQTFAIAKEGYEIAKGFNMRGQIMRENFFDLPKEKQDEFARKNPTIWSALERLKPQIAESKREVVAAVTGKTREEILTAERQGASLEKLYQSVKKIPLSTDSSESKAALAQTVSMIDHAHLSKFSADTLKVGQSVDVQLNGGQSSIRVVRSDDAQNPFRVMVGGREAFACNGKNLAAHIELGELFSKNGLAFLIPVSGELLRKVSVEEGSKVGAEDGTLSGGEKRGVLKAFARAFQVEGFPNGAVEVAEMERYLSTYVEERRTSFQNIGRRLGLVTDSGEVRREAVTERV